MPVRSCHTTTHRVGVEVHDMPLRDSRHHESFKQEKDGPDREDVSSKMMSLRNDRELRKSVPSCISARVSPTVSLSY